MPGSVNQPAGDRAPDSGALLGSRLAGRRVLRPGPDSNRLPSALGPRGPGRGFRSSSALLATARTGAVVPSMHAVLWVVLEGLAWRVLEAGEQGLIPHGHQCIAPGPRGRWRRKTQCFRGETAGKEPSPDTRGFKSRHSPISGGNASPTPSGGGRAAPAQPASTAPPTTVVVGVGGGGKPNVSGKKWPKMLQVPTLFASSPDTIRFKSRHFRLRSAAVSVVVLGGRPAARRPPSRAARARPTRAAPTAACCDPR